MEPVKSGDVSLPGEALQLLAEARDALLLLDATGSVVFANAAAAQLLGVPHEQLLGRPFDLPCTGADQGVQGEVCGDCRGCRPCEIEVQSTATAWQGRPARLLWLRPSGGGVPQLQLLQRSVESASNGIVICDALRPDLPIIYVNPAFERLTGYALHEVVGRNCRFLQGNDREQAGLPEVRSGLRERRDVHVVLRNYRKDGSVMWNELFISPIVDAAGVATHYVGVLNDVTEQRRYESELMYTINHDVLTALPNRTLLEDRLRQACQTARRFRSRLAVLFIDLDGFKLINDTMGHRLGDELLVEAARRMSQQVRAEDTVARMGGDEFIVLLANLDNEDSVPGVAERLLQVLAQPYRLGGTPLHVTASIGITLSDGQLENPAHLIQQADLAMFQAKQQGRNNYQWYTDGLDRQVVERLALRNELRTAIQQGQLELHYQPQFDGRSGRVVAIEALLRWPRAEGGCISATELVGAAEDAGQTVALCSWVLLEACRFNRRLREQGLADVPVAVNIASRSFRRPDFVEAVRAALAASGLPPDRLELEVTEAVFMADPDEAVATVRALKELGVGVAIDDFGTGLSSLNHLKRMPIDKVKVDRSFIQDIISDRHDANITQGIISMAHHLRLQVVAEGVETEAQYYFLRKIQCDAFQGYFFAHPLPAPELEVFLRDRRSLPGERAPQEKRRPTLLLLDDEENILRALGRLLRREGYEILMATRAQDAFEILACNEVQVIISDQRMPEMCGIEFLSRVKGLYPDTVRIVLSGYTDLGTITDAINQGEIYKFLLKPWDDDQLRGVVAQAFRHWNESTAPRP